MAAVLNLKDAETHALAAELAAEQGVSLNQIVKEALREKRDRMQDKRSRLADRLMEIGQRCSRLPVLDPRSPEEILGYDEHGLPH